jgi:hypothetical protein
MMRSNFNKFLRFVCLVAQIIQVCTSNSIRLASSELNGNWEVRGKHLMVEYMHLKLGFAWQTLALHSNHNVESFVLAPIVDFYRFHTTLTIL